MIGVDVAAEVQLVGILDSVVAWEVTFEQVLPWNSPVHSVGVVA